MDTETYKPILFGKVKNQDILDLIDNPIKEIHYDKLIIEMIASYRYASR